MITVREFLKTNDSCALTINLEYAILIDDSKLKRYYCFNIDSNEKLPDIILDMQVVSWVVHVDLSYRMSMLVSVTRSDDTNKDDVIKAFGKFKYAVNCE